MAAPLPITATIDVRSQARQVLAAKSAFNSCLPNILDALIERATIVTFEQNDVVCRQGDRGNHMLVVVSGALKVARNLRDGSEVEISYVKRGEIIGEIAAIVGGTRTAGIVALEPTKAVAIEGNHLRDLLHANPAAMFAVLVSVCERLRRTNARLDEVASDIAADQSPVVTTAA
jgi:CRP/FNR family transcriptional regulator, cyclic AMP receptor protein